MTVKDSFVVGSKVDIRIDEGIYRTVIQNVDGDNDFTASALTVGTTLVSLRPGTRCVVSVTKPDCIIRVNAVISKSFVEPETELMMFRFKVVSTPHRIQRRENFRLSILLSAELWEVAPDALTSSVLTEDDIALSLNCTVRDISAGGAKIYSPAPLEEGRIMFCAIELSDDETVTVIVEVRRVTAPEEPNKPYVLGVMFVKPDKLSIQKITKFLYQKQLKLRNIKGK